MRSWLAALGVAGIAAVAGEGRAEAPPAPAPPAPAAPAQAPAASDPLGSAYERAFDALARGDRETAARLFDEVAAGTSDPVRRETCVRMAQRARAMPPGAARPAPVPAVLPTAAPPFAPRAADDEPSSTPRSSLLAGSTLLGLTAYGGLVPVALGLGDDQATGAYLLTAASSFVVPYLATRGTPITWGTTNTWLWGSTRGFLHGYMLAFALGCDDGARTCSDRTLSGLALAGSVLEGSGGAILAHRSGLGAGASRTIGTGGDFGLGLGLGLGVLVHAYDLDDQRGTRAFATLGLAGAAAGAAGGAFLASRRDYSMGDAEVMRTVGLLGIAVSGLPLVLAKPEQPELFAGLLMAGAVGGLATGDWFVRGKHLTYGQALITDLGTVAGALTTSGVALLAGGIDSPEMAYSLVLAGALGGFVLTSRSVGTPGAGAEEPPPRVSLQLLPLVGPERKGVALAVRF